MEEIVNEEVLFPVENTPVDYVTYDEQGSLTGSYIQCLLPEHEDCHLIVTPEQRMSWVMFKMSEDRLSLVPNIVTPPTTVVTIEEEKSKVNQAINEWRLSANFSSFHYDGKEIACDTLSRSDLDGVANYVNLFGEFPIGWNGAWKAVDNTYVTLDDIQDFKDMYAAMVDQGNSNFATAQQLKQQLSQAGTIEAVEAVRNSLETLNG